MTQHAERRRETRKPIEFFVQEHVDGKTFLHPAINLSSDGIYILAASGRKIIDGDSVMELEFTLPTGDEIRATGRIAHVYQEGEQLGVGIRFASFNEGSREAIETFLKS
jgi:hypothetical protein